MNTPKELSIEQLYDLLTPGHHELKAALISAINELKPEEAKELLDMWKGRH